MPRPEQPLVEPTRYYLPDDPLGLDYEYMCPICGELNPFYQEAKFCCQGEEYYDGDIVCFMCTDAALEWAADEKLENIIKAQEARG